MPIEGETWAVNRKLVIESLKRLEDQVNELSVKLERIERDFNYLRGKWVVIAALGGALIGPLVSWLQGLWRAK